MRHNLVGIFLICLSLPAPAQDFIARSIKISHPFARETPPGAATGAAYFEVSNSGAAADKLLRLSSKVAAKAELHSMTMDNGVMRMRKVDQLTINPSSTLTLQPGSGYHVMLIDLKQPLQAGEKFPLQLEFAKAGKLDIMVVVEKRGTDHPHH